MTNLSSLNQVNAWKNYPIVVVYIILTFTYINHGSLSICGGVYVFDLKRDDITRNSWGLTNINEISYVPSL